MKQKKKSIQELSTEKHERMMEGIAIWTSFYRNNPHRFVKEFLNIDLKLFQIFLLYSMMHNNYVIYVAARGQGKTWLTALFCVVRCILYPGTQIVIAAGIRSQANAVLEKVTKIFCKANDWGSVNLSNEIDWNETKVGQNDSQIQFKNGSYMIVVTANDNARSKRANIIIVDEARMVSLDVITTVLKRFLTSPRSPKYLNNPKYRHLQERNKEIYMSSAWYKNHWFYSKVRTFFANMLDSNKKYFVCSIPYQISIKEGLLIRNQVED